MYWYRSINSIQQLEKKQAKAKELRERLLLDRTEKVRELTKKVEEVRLHKSGLLDEKKLWMEQKLNKAETKRQQQLDERVKKAHDEEMKGKEIAFIQVKHGNVFFTLLFVSLWKQLRSNTPFLRNTKKVKPGF